MKKNLLLGLISILMVSYLGAQELKLTYSFEHPVIMEDANGYKELIFENATNFNDEGNPLIPHYACELLLPPGTEIEEVEVISTVFTEDVTNIRIKPASKQFPISIGAPDNYKVVPNAVIYNSPNAYPENFILGANTQYLSGHAIGLFNICPLVYYPLEEKVRILKEITVEVKYSNSERASNALGYVRSNTSVQERILGIIDNPEQLSSYQSENEREINENDILIITSEELIPAFQEYIDFKTGTGYITEAVAVEDIYSNYTGDDNPMKIRNCIIDYYTNFGTSYVILGGDADPANPEDEIVPHRGLFAVSDNDIASDMYYSCLDGNWNDDGDNKWGETGEYDVFSEVAIGRICVDNDLEVERSIYKLIMYQNAPVVEDIEQALMVGENLNNSPLTWGGTYKDQIAEGSSEHGFTTGPIWDSWNVDYLYERDMSWSRNDLYNAFNETGCHLLNHLGHSNVTYNMKLYTNNLTTMNFTNDGINRGYVIGYSQGCYNGSFDNRTDGGGYSSECFAEVFQSLETGEVASIANSRYGWYAPGNTNSSSQFHDRQFFDAIFSEDIFQIGWVNSDAQGDNASMMEESEYMRWTVYEANLFGDPSMDIWTSIPTDIVADYPISLAAGLDEFSCETDVANARVALMQNGDLLGRGLTDEFGNITLPLFETVGDNGLVYLSIIAHDKNRLFDSLYVITDGPYVVYNSHIYNDPDGNANGLIDYNESIKMSLDMINIGVETANNVEVTISCDDEYISITDNTESFGNFDVSQVVSIENAFAFDVAENIPDEHEFVIRIDAVGEDSWISYTTGMAYAPVLTVSGYIIDDTEYGNGNGYAEAGETISLIIPAGNAGHSISPESIMSITTESEYLTIVEDEYNVGIIEPGAQIDAVFTMSIDENTPVGNIADFNCTLTAGSISTENIFPLKVGLIVEDWETGNFETFDWYQAGDADWAICEDNPFEGNYCIRSGEIDDGDKSRLYIIMDVTSDDSVSFYRKVSSQEGADYLNFFIDMTVVDQWSGENDWEKVSYPVSGGLHEFQWIYKKDDQSSEGEDCGWIDYINLPMSETYFVSTNENLAAIKHNDLITYPNPFTNDLNIVFTLDRQDIININIYNQTGKLIKTLESKANMSKGLNKIIWDGKGSNGNNLPAGFYYINVQGSSFNATTKLSKLN